MLNKRQTLFGPSHSTRLCHRMNFQMTRHQNQIQSHPIQIQSHLRPSLSLSLSLTLNLNLSLNRIQLIQNQLILSQRCQLIIIQMKTVMLLSLLSMVIVLDVSLRVISSAWTEIASMHIIPCRSSAHASQMLSTAQIITILIGISKQEKNLLSVIIKE